MSELCSGELRFSPSSVKLLRSDRKGRILKWTFTGEFVKVKELSLNLDIHHEDIQSLHSHWEKLAQLRDDHLLQYQHISDVQDDGVRYFVPVMGLCQGSMLDYCRKTLDEGVASLLKATDVMWQITCGLHYLQRHKINQGHLKLKNVLFWKRNSKSRRVVVKLTGYGYNCHKNEEKIDITRQLGCLFYSVATKEEAKPNGSISLHSLNEMDVNHKAPASALINLLINGSLFNSFEVGILLRHPLFIRCTDEGRSRLIQDSMDDNAGLRWNDKETIRKWLDSVEEGKFPDEDLDDFKEIVLESENKETTIIVNEALKSTPQLFSEYIWHTTIGSGEVSNNISKEHTQTHSIEIQDRLGKGNYGKVYKCQYTDGIGKRYPAACKKCNPKPEAEEVFNREIETLQKLNHLFVIKYLDAVEKDSKKYIVMELCEGSLKEYVEGKLERIPKDSLDDKILIGQIALGLAYIHSQGIIHKDLKLENILLKYQSPRLVLTKIADFGFAKQLKPGKSEFSVTEHPGTETYMAPELLVAKEGEYPATFASDVYALGITIARIVLKGEHPFSPNAIWQKVSMIKGLVPQNLEGLSWDLTDLILKLTDKDKEKRPEMVLVLRHPYFVLTNDRTKKHFVDRLWADFDVLSREDEKKYLEMIFSRRIFLEWYDTISEDKTETVKEKEEMEEALRLLRCLIESSDVQADKALNAAKQYEKTIKDAIKSEHDQTYENKINQMYPMPQGFSYAYILSWQRLYKLIQRAPKLFIPYLWAHIHDSHSKLIISELEWSSLYHDDKEIIDEMWNTKYSKDYKKDTETLLEIINMVRRCNVSEGVWSELLDRIEKSTAVDLLYSAVKSFASNAPEVTEMILQRYGITFEMATVIHIAALNTGDWGDKIMQKVLKYGGKPNAIDHEKRTAVHYAAENDSRLGPKIMKLLLDHGGDPNTKSKEKVAPIHLAVQNTGDYSAEVLELLIDNGGDCSVIDWRGGHCLEPIHLAIMNNGESSPKLLDLLLKKRGASVINNETEMSLIHYAVLSNGDCGTEIMKKLLESGANPNARDKKKCTPLYYAASRIDYHNIATMKILLENGGDPNAVDENGRTPVDFAACNEGKQAFEKLKLLLTHGGKLNVKDKFGLTPVHAALLNIGICGIEIRKLVGANEQIANLPLNDSGETLLHWLISVENEEYKVERVQLILDNGGNPNAVDNRGWSPVHYTVRLNHSFVGLDIFQLLALLLKKGGDPNLPDKKDQCTPVHHAADNKSDTGLKKMKILLENGGNANAISKEGSTPLHLAAMNSGIHGPELTRTLLEHGGNQNITTNVNKRTPLHCAMIMETNIEDQLRLDIIKQLLEKGGNPNAADSLGMTPVHYVIGEHRSNSLEVLKLLLEHGGNILQEDNQGLTPHRIAQIGRAPYCNPEVMQHILRTYRHMR